MQNTYGFTNKKTADLNKVIFGEDMKLELQKCIRRKELVLDAETVNNDDNSTKECQYKKGKETLKCEPLCILEENQIECRGYNDTFDPKLSDNNYFLTKESESVTRKFTNKVKYENCKESYLVCIVKPL